MSAKKKTVVKKKKRVGRPRRVGPPTVAKKWYDVDWQQSDPEIARQMGVSRQRINQVRQIVGIKRTPPPRPSEIARRWLVRNRRRTPKLTAVEAAEQAGVTLHAMRQAASDLGVRFRRDYTPAPWRSMPINWSLPSTDIQEIWHLPTNTAGKLRSRDVVPRPKWHRAHDAGSRSYQNALRREREKAKEYRRTVGNPYQSSSGRKGESR